jgi:hypothetical protein
VHVCVSLCAVHYRFLHPSSGFVHPGQCAGPAEVALMQWRAQHSMEPTNTSAVSLITGEGVSKKMYYSLGGDWWPETGELGLST